MAAILIAKLEERRLGLRVEDVVEVLWAVAVTPLPGAPEVVEGMIDVRGTLVPVVNARPRFGHGLRPPRLSDRIVLVRGEERVVGLRFDSADSVIEIEEDEISEAAGFGPAPRGVSGVVKLADGLVLIHRMEAFLSSTEAAALEEALAAREDGRIE